MFHFSSAFLVPSDEARLGDGTVDIVISYNALIESELAALLCLAFVAWSRDKANIISSNRKNVLMYRNLIFQEMFPTGIFFLNR